MSNDNFNEKPDNNISKDEELASILKKLSTLLDKSVSLDEAVELAKGKTATEGDTDKSESPVTDEAKADEQTEETAEAVIEEASEKSEEPEDSEEIECNSEAVEEEVQSDESDTPEAVITAETEETKEDAAEDTAEESVEEADAATAVTEEVASEEKAEESAEEEAPAVLGFLKNLRSSHFASGTKGENAPVSNNTTDILDENVTPIEDNTSADEQTAEVPATAEVFAVNEADDVAEEATEEASATEEESDTAEEEAISAEAEETEEATEEPVVRRAPTVIAAPLFDSIPQFEAPAVEETPEETYAPTEDETQKDEQPVAAEQAEETTEPTTEELSPINAETTDNTETGTDTATLKTERAPLIPTEDNTEDSSTSKIFDELLACFDDHKLPDDFRFSEYNAAQSAKDADEAAAEEVVEKAPSEEQTTEQQPAPFVPLDHTEPSPEDELFSQIFSEEKSEKKNKARDKKKWQNNKGYAPTLLTTLYDWLEVIVLSTAFAILMFTFVIRLAVVDGHSMNNTLHDDELLVISNFMYEPQNNDIIVFSSPNYDVPLVKRIIATEGQTVDIDFENWVVTVNGTPLDESDYIDRIIGQAMHSDDVSFPLVVPEGHVFVMGDNRNNSSDSRSSRVGFVDERYILGKVKLRLTPFNKFGTVD